jgi:hypothetical protein
VIYYYTHYSISFERVLRSIQKNLLLGTVHYLYPRGGGDSYVIYKNLVALPPLDDLNVEDPPIKYWKSIHPPHLYECFNCKLGTLYIKSRPRTIVSLAYFCFTMTKWLFVLEQYAEFDLLFVLQLEYLRYTDPNPFVPSLTLTNKCLINYLKV